MFEIFSEKIVPFITSHWLLFTITFVLLIGPILILIIKLCQILFFIIKCNCNFLIKNLNPKKNTQTKDNDFSEPSNISISNNHPSQNENLSLIELKILEMKQKENNNRHQENSLLRLEMNQQIYQNKLEDKLEIHKLEQKIFFLEKEMQRIQNNEIIDKNRKENFSKNYDNNFSEKDNSTEENDFVKNQIPESLNKIFEKISDFENVQLLMLNKMMNDKSYYDSDKNVLYINPQDINFVKNFLIGKQKKENIKLTN
ncbi:hypothetical protein CWO85_03405 [Candidatus Phytoplasma ziziphi]|uniref:Uncharacterized protein n=1 Tax=Ziziphus jujuba witches'-broom phytoplasma TaxID=135727 RepID=A0A660HNA1_ZIZJU|nr:hypothetical protein [Candidatus Phytoplasma ziziphi]AYJ01523.1 hypothetical protein CWO85_03405 [Candidatus Phytoplasma ziziphi]